jgi:hypothetical protein
LRDAGPTEAGTTHGMLLWVAVWIGLAAIVNPVGDFPLNDDWSYGRAVKTLVEEGRFELCGWTSMPLVAQVGWGAIFCLPFGFSFTALRISTLVLGAVGLLATGSLLREAGAGRRTTLFGMALVATNPVYLGLAHTFMTDIPFFAAAIGSAALLSRALRTGSRHAWAAGLALAVVATLIRQLGLVLPLAYGVALVVRDGFRLRTLARAGLSIALVATPLLLYEAELRAGPGEPALYRAQTERILALLGHGAGPMAVRMAGIGADAIVELGAFLLPAAFVLAGPLRGGLGRGEKIALTLGGLGFAAVQGLRLLRESRLVPLAGGCLFDLGCGPIALRDVGILSLPHGPRAPAGLWVVVTVAGLIAGGAAVWTILLALRRGLARRDPVAVMLVVTVVVYVVPLMASDYFDRYLLPLLPLLGAAAIRLRAPDARPGRVAVTVAVLLLVLQGAFGVAATRDYLAWNRARWDLVRHATAELGVRPEQLDGGFEVNGWRLYDPEYRETPARSFWWVEDDEYVLTMGSMPGYRSVAERPFRRWLPPGEGRVLLLRREP